MGRFPLADADIQLLLTYLFVYLLGVAVPLIIAYAIIKGAVLAALRQHAREQSREPASPRLGVPNVAAERPKGYKGAKVLSMPEDPK